MKFPCLTRPVVDWEGGLLVIFAGEFVLSEGTVCMNAELEAGLTG